MGAGDDVIHAYGGPERILLPMNRLSIPPEEVREWDDAIFEYLEAHPETIPTDLSSLQERTLADLTKEASRSRPH